MPKVFTFFSGNQHSRYPYIYIYANVGLSAKHIKQFKVNVTDFASVCWLLVYWC